jgi:hypothetical protein
MKLGQALLTRKDLMKSITDLQERYVQAAVHPENDAPDEAAQDLFGQFEQNLAEVERLTVTINNTNNVTKVGDLTMMESIVHRDLLKLKVSSMASIVSQLRSRNRSRLSRYGGEQQKEVLAEGVNVTEMSKLADAASKELRLLDMAIQEVNWTAELV